MPGPLASFTKSKWLAFFAELTAKITHHNVLVVMEGCEVIKRLLVSQVSVAAFLEEGSLLLHLVDTIAGDMLSNERRDFGPPLVIAERLLFTQLETLSLIVEMMIALHADKDSYFCLLVLARAGLIASTLIRLLQRQHPRFFGVMATMVKALLGLPFGREVRGLSHVDESRSVALACHIRQLQAEVAQHGVILQEAVETLQTLSISTNGVIRHCSVFLLNLAAQRFRRVQKTRKHDAADAEVLSMRNAGLNRSEHILADTTLEDSMENHAAMSAATATKKGGGGGEGGGGGYLSSFDKDDARVLSGVLEESDEPMTVEHVEFCIPDEVYDDCFDRLSKCRSHNEFLDAMNCLWCLTVAAGGELERRFTSLQFEHAFKRFLRTMPLNQQDQMVFTSVLLWLSHMMSGYCLRGDTRDSILSVAGPSLIQIVLQDTQRRDALRMHGNSVLSFTDASSASLLSSSSTRATMVMTGEARATKVADRSAPTLGADSLPPSYIAGDKRTELVEQPSISLLVVSFLLIAECACGPQQVEGWIREAGLFAMVEILIRNVEHTKSALIDTPTTEDGALSDEVYLSCAMASTRTEHVTLAALSCKLLSSIVWNHYAVLSNLLTRETSLMLQTIIPLLIKISIHNPTLTSAIENVSGSVLHHSPRCQRSSRYTSLGECSLVALDACFWLTEVAKQNVVHLEDVIPSLLALSRATRNSIHPPIRASVYRCLVRLCRSPAELVTVAREMPSVVNAAVTSVLEYSPAAPQWEAAAAAEWLAHVIHIASGDINIEQHFNFSCTALPIKLVELSSSNGITYATAAFLSLIATLFDQQKRFADKQEAKFASVILPCGRRSLECWSRLIQTATQTGEKLAHAHSTVIPAATTTKDALSRSLSSIEGISVQFFFVCSLARGLLFLLDAHPEHRDYFSNGVMYGLFASTFSLPSPEEVFNMLAVRFGVRMEQHHTLERSYESMLQWMMELCSAWFVTTTCPGGSGDDGGMIASNGRKSASQSLPVLQPVVFDHLCKIMRNDRISQPTRAHVCFLVSSVLVPLASPPPPPPSSPSSPSFASASSRVAPAAASATTATTTAPSNEISAVDTSLDDLRKALGYSSGSLFSASLCLDPVSCVSGMQCRLVALFSGANEEAHCTGWFATKVVELQEHVQALKENAGTAGSQEMELLLVSLSAVCSVLSFDRCRAIPDEVLHSLCLSLRQLLGYETTRRAAFQAAEALVFSGEGRRLLLHEVSTTGDPHSRTCFGRILGITLGVAYTGEHRQLQRDNNNATRRTPMSERDALMTAVATAGFDICAIACGKGGEDFTRCVMKMRGVDHIESLFLKYDRRRSPVPLGVLRLVATISFHLEAQQAIIRQTELVTMLIEAAANASSAGTLALLVIRNLCFNPTMKTQLCQDDRILLALKAALMAQPTLQPLLHDNNASDSNENIKAMSSQRGEMNLKRVSPQKVANQASGQQQQHQKTDGGSSTGVLDNANILRRQELAVTALWSLMYDNQRGKSYVRNVLNDAPAINMGKLMTACGQVPVKTAELQEYPANMSEGIGSIKMLGKGAF